jgi:hypothetical protein
MVQGQTKVISAYKASTFDVKSSSMGAIKKQSPFEFKEQNRKSTSSNMKGGNNDNKKADPWGKVFKNEQHFKSLHIC